jgi:hypothetical protein
MTIAQLLEQVFGKFGAYAASKMNATTFMNNEQSYHAIADALESMGIQREGEEILYSGITGKMFTSSVFMGPLYFMRIKHLVQDKLNARGKGRKEIRTHQPTGGRGAEGGMRIGEMERDAVLAHGVSLFLQESMMKRADGTHFWVCNGCGTIPISNDREQLFVCPTCDGPIEFSGDTAENMTLIKPLKRSRVTFSNVEMPYALKLLDQELTTFMGAGLRFVTSKTVGRLKENFLEWAKEGGYNPAPPKAYQEMLKQLVPLDVKPPVKDDGLPGLENEVIHGEALVGGSLVTPQLELKIEEIENYPIKDASIDIPKIGGGTDVIGNNSDPIQKLIDLQQSAGGKQDLESNEITTKQDSEEEESNLQVGGEAEIELIGKDPVPVKQVFVLNQNGGMAPIVQEPEVKLDIKGTEIEPAIFSQQQMSSEPFVIANPFVSPPITAEEAVIDSPPVGQIPVPSQLEQPVASSDVIKAINVFENADIRVIKLA